MIYLEEKYEGRRPSDGDRPANEIPYLIFATEGEVEEEALVALRAGTPPTLGDLKLTQCQITAAHNDHFEGVATYASDATTKETGESSFTFDTTGGTFHLTQSKQTMQSRMAGGVDGPNLKGVIGATADGEPAGVDITLPQYAFSETHYLADEDVTLAYRGLLFALTGTKNNATFKGCAAGECLFLGARGSKRGRGDWEITFLFAASPNVTDLTIGDITGINKKGWDYLWVRYVPIVVELGGSLGKILSQAPQIVLVEKVYDDADHSLLAIGTT